MSDINLGPFRMNPRGEIQPSKQYKFMDLVTYKGSAYLNINNDIIDGTASIGQLPVGYGAPTKYYMLICAKGDKGDIADRYDSFITITNNNWDYSLSDKIKLGTGFDITKPLFISNVYDGCCGMIKTNKDIILPNNVSDISIDFNYCTLMQNQYYIYTFIYDGSLNRFTWNRAVYKHGE